MWAGFVEYPSLLLFQLPQTLLYWDQLRRGSPQPPCMHVIYLTLKPSVSGALGGSGWGVLCLLLKGHHPHSSEPLWLVPMCPPPVSSPCPTSGRFPAECGDGVLGLRWGIHFLGLL